MGIPGDRRLNDGDIVGVDVGICYEGYFGDSAVTVAVGKASREAQRLIQTTEKALYKAIEQAKEGRRLGDISFAIESCASKAGFSVVKDLYGHGIGKELHEDPLIPNYGKRGEGVKLESGMVLAIEPMLNIGRYEIETLKDGWTVVTKDRSLSAHFEHTILVGSERTEILTKLR
ncbi:type I methionyl aminopeptidase [Candidatus Margulisiibacteriota bacterium]